MLKDCTPGPYVVLEAMGSKFVAAKPTDDHPYHKRTRYMDVAGDEDYPRKDADLKLLAASYDMALLLLDPSTGPNWCQRRDEILRKAGLL